MDYLISEQAVLAACLADDTGRSSATAVERLTEDDFTTEAHREIFKLLASSTEPLNEVDVAIELPHFKAEALDLVELHGGGKVDRYVEQVEQTRNRRIAEHSIHHAMDLLKDGKSAEEIASIFNTKVAKALTGGTGQVKIGQAANEAYSEFLAIDAGDSSAISTSFSKLDEALSGGFHPGKLYVLAARPGIGKSALAIHFSHEIAKKGYRIAYASLEMSAAECAGRLLSRESRVSRPCKKGDLLPAHKKKLELAKQKMKHWPITFKDDAEATLDSFRAFLVQERAKGDIGLAVIDYLQLLSAPGYKTRVEEVTHISRSLKQISLQLEIPILALSQLSRELEKQNRKPMLSDLRDSGSIEQDCDSCFLLSSESKENPLHEKIRVHVAKNRNGENNLACVLMFTKNLGRFKPEGHLNDDYDDEEDIY